MRYLSLGSLNPLVSALSPHTSGLGFAVCWLAGGIYCHVRIANSRRPRELPLPLLHYQVNLYSQNVMCILNLDKKWRLYELGTEVYVIQPNKMPSHT